MSLEINEYVGANCIKQVNEQKQNKKAKPVASKDKAVKKGGKKK